MSDDAPVVRIAGFEPLPSEGLELRFELKLRVQNMNPSPLVYDGLSVRLDIDGRGLASGVSGISGEIPRFSDAVLTVPVSISAFDALRQFFARITDGSEEGAELTRPASYQLSGKLGGVGSALATRFGDTGELNLLTDTNSSQ